MAKNLVMTRPSKMAFSKLVPVTHCDVYFTVLPLPCKKKHLAMSQVLDILGGAKGDRTPDLMTDSQASLPPG